MAGPDVSEYRIVSIFIMAVWFIQLAGGILGVVTPVALDAMQLSSVMIGLIASVFSIGFVFGALAAPSVIGQVGNIRAFAAAAAVGAVTAHLMGAALIPTAWVVLRFAQGVGFAIMFAAIESWMGAIIPSNRRGSLMGVYHLAAKAGLLLGPFLIFGVSAMEVLPYTLTGVFFAIALIAVCVTRQQEPPRPEKFSSDPRRLLRISPAASATIFVTGVLNTGVLALLPVIVSTLDWPMSSSQAAILTLAAAQFGGLISQWPTGIISDHAPRRLVMAVMFLIGGLAAIALVFLSGIVGYVAFLAIIGIWGSGSLSLYGIAVAHGLDRAENQDVTPLLSFYLFVWAAGSIVGPALFGVVIAMNGFFAAIAAVMLIMSGALFIRLKLTAPPPSEDQEDFSPVLTTSTIISQVDPRAGEE